MQLQEAISLITYEQPANAAPQTWADLGCGSGLFTYALAHQLPVHSTVYAIDKTKSVLEAHPNPRHVTIHQQHLDFAKNELHLQDLDGILMANSLHYVDHKVRLINRLKAALKENGIFLIVEYESRAANPWVPYPVTEAALKDMFREAGFNDFLHLGQRPSVFGAGDMYAMIARQKG